MVNIKLLFIIINEGNDKKIKNILNKFGIKIKTITNANGTASPSVLNYFGLVETKKEIYMAIIPDYLTEDIITKIKSNFDFNKIGIGIIFTVPISSSNKFLSESFKKENIRSVDMENNDIKYHVVITIVAEGYLEQVMTAAKRAGSSGGTAIKGRGLTNSKRAKILGFNIEPERDIVLNIVSSSDKNKVMEEITKEVGIKTKGRGVCFSLPVDNAIGIDLLKEY